MTTRSPLESSQRIRQRSDEHDQAPKEEFDTYSHSVLKLKLEHIIVLGALEDANRSHGRVVSVGEVAGSLSRNDKKRLENTYSNDLSTILAKILNQLRTRGFVFSPDNKDATGRRYYGASNLLASDEHTIPSTQSRRRLVLELVREAAINLGRAVRSGEVLEHIASNDRARSLTQTEITRDMLNLEKTGELCVVGRVYGNSEGQKLYMPADMDASQYRPEQPLTRLDEIARAVETLWAERQEEAAVRGVRPKPLTTGEIRARLVSSPTFSTPKWKRKSQFIVEAVKSLAESQSPLLRKIKRAGEMAVLWVPVGIGDEDIDLSNAYGNDAERICEAVQRAERRLGRPVNVHDVNDEIVRDSSLRPAGSSGLFSILSTVSKKKINTSSGKGSQERVTHRLYGVGRIGGDTYYCTDDAPEAHIFIAFRQLEQRLAALRAEEQLAALDTISLAGVAKGRAMLLLKELSVFHQELTSITASEAICGTTQREAEVLQSRIDQLTESVSHWLTSGAFEDSCIPTDVSTEIIGLTAEELHEILKPLYPRAQVITDRGKLIALTSTRIRRFPNPSYESRFAKDPCVAAEFLYDRTDALLHAAKRWGGPECSLQATLASNELGLLRDPRFIFPALKSKSFEIRLAGVACLAFLWSDEGNDQLRRLAVEDPDAGVRQSAVWAYGFAKGEQVPNFIREQRYHDTNAHMRAFLETALQMTDKGWWAL